MKKIFKLSVLVTSLLLGGVLVTNTYSNTGLKEIAADALTNEKAISLKKASIGSDATISYSRTYAQTGVNPDNGNDVIRFATAISGGIKSAFYTRSIEGLPDATKEITTFYKGISADVEVQYYDGTDLTTVSSEATSSYYWACYTIEFVNSTYKASDIKVELTLKDEAGETYNPEYKVGNHDLLTSKVVEFNFDSAVENGADFSTVGKVADGRISVSGSNGLLLPEPITISTKESFTLEATVRGNGGILLSSGHTSGGFLNIPNNQNDIGTNGFTLRDPLKTASLFFTKDANKLGHKKHLAMVYDKASGTLKAYEDGVEMPFKNQAGSLATFQDTTFIKMFGGYGSSNYSGEVYHFRYVNKPLAVEDFKIEKDEVLEFNFDSYQENGMDFSGNGTITDGMLKVNKGAKLALPKPIIISNKKSFSLELTVQTYANGEGGTGDVILGAGVTTGGFLNIPSGNDDASGNGFTLRDTEKTASILFRKDPNKLGQKKHLVMVYNAHTRKLSAYEDGAAMTMVNQVANSTFETFKDTTFSYFLGGYGNTVFRGDLYHFRYIDRDLATAEYKTNE